LAPIPWPAAEPPINDALLATEDVTDDLQPNLRTVYRLLKAGRIPAVRVGRQWRFRKADIDLLITDVKMPGMDGLTLTREARPLTLTLPVVIITAQSTDASAIETINLGVIGYLTKPFLITSLFSTAARALGQ
jgi:excisionase family DNA binding protein